MIFDSSAGALRKISRAKIIGAPSVTSVSPTNLTTGDGTGNHTIIVNGTDFASDAPAGNTPDCTSNVTLPAEPGS